MFENGNARTACRQKDIGDVRIIAVSGNGVYEGAMLHDIVDAQIAELKDFREHFAFAFFERSFARGDRDHHFDVFFRHILFVVLPKFSDNERSAARNPRKEPHDRKKDFFKRAQQRCKAQRRRVGM